MDCPRRGSIKSKSHNHGFVQHYHTVIINATPPLFKKIKHPHRVALHTTWHYLLFTIGAPRLWISIAHHRRADSEEDKNSRTA
ncbi:hypothetical protein L218DRAFT_957551 [Marasmius fiardii PR-910]|nr:hypothetical protein L218DRAFT_957551 [Marasmius fiardii PR-910]